MLPFIYILMDPPEKEGFPPEKKPSGASAVAPPPLMRSSSEGGVRDEGEGAGAGGYEDSNALPVSVGVYEGIPIASTTGTITISHIDPYEHFSKPGVLSTPETAFSGGGGVAPNSGSELNDDQWRSSVFSCFSDPQSAMDNLLCCYCNLSSQANMLLNNKRGVHFPLCLGMACVDYFCFAGMCSCVSFCVVNIMVRQAIRHRYHLKTGIGNMAMDFLMGTCCAVCALCQQHREMSSRGHWPGCILVGFDPLEVAPVTAEHVNIE